MKTNKEGFTLLELLVAMAIIGILIALAIFGIIAAQRTSRETQRRNALEDINIGIQEFYDKYNKYPNSINFDAGIARLCENIGGTCVANDITQRTLEVELNASAESGTRTTNNQTQYFYSNQPVDGYQLAACLERDKEIENAGTATALVDDIIFTCL